MLFIRTMLLSKVYFIFQHHLLVSEIYITNNENLIVVKSLKKIITEKDKNEVCMQVTILNPHKSFRISIMRIVL